MIVRVYQLKGKEKIEGLISSPLERGSEDPRRDLLDRQEITLLPDTKVEVKVDPQEGRSIWR